jgi:hypothetical protein
MKEDEHDQQKGRDDMEPNENGGNFQPPLVNKNLRKCNTGGFVSR